MIQFKSIEKLADFISAIADRNPCIISIDGVDGSGKSCLSHYLTHNTKLRYIDIDGEYLIPNLGKYVSCIEYDKLESDIYQSLVSGDSVVVDGICISKILENIGLIANIKVYVKNFVLGKWFDGDLFDYSCNIEDVIAAKRKDDQEFADIEATIECRGTAIVACSEESMKEEIIRYHFEYHPDHSADIIFGWLKEV